MAIPRLFCPINLAHRAQANLPNGAAHHAIRVLRLKCDDEVRLFNGEGGEYEARIHRVEKDIVTVDIGRHHDSERESKLKVCLAQAITTGDKMDYTLQKAVELGVARIQPLQTRRSVVRLNQERAEKRLQHWQNVVVSACEQCGRNTVPQVAAILPFEEWVAVTDASTTRLMLSPYAEHSLRDCPAPTGAVNLTIGPEGGLNQDEVAFAQAKGFTSVRIGPRVLRTETAPLAALAAMQILWGDF
ncbi:MAG: 16S rRNA (uracil(1498)-N(3))-methyltransferase [Pseudomonadota bacterium]|nr:16S rRNA (uracil(1498)-N(3))-methyltransferase [Pseudomonadota bacterium]